MSILPDLDALSFDAVIPSVLLFNENLEPNAIKLYAFVRGLTKAHGYCFAMKGPSNVYYPVLKTKDSLKLKQKKAVFTGKDVSF